MTELSVIIPYVNEWPMNVFTIRNIAEELRDRVDFEIIAVNNYCDEVAEQPGNVRSDDDKAGQQLKGVMRGHPWLKAIDYPDKLSHWQAKNKGVQHSSGKWLFFCDAHCIISRDALFNMYNYVIGTEEWFHLYRNRILEKKVLINDGKKPGLDPMQGSIHLPLTYHIMDYKSTQYKLVANVDEGEVAYSLTPYRPDNHPDNPVIEVPCMSTCGMMISRELYDYIGGWPKELGIYGGGEPFINFTLSTMGMSKFIFKGPPLTHHGNKRGYSWNFDDHFRNKCIATYIYGGEDLAWRLVDHHRGDKNILGNICNDAIQKCKPHREFIKPKQIISIQDWVKKWQ